MDIIEQNQEKPPRKTRHLKPSKARTKKRLNIAQALAAGDGNDRYKDFSMTVSLLNQAFSHDFSISEACEFAGISRPTFYRWMQEYPEMQARFDSLKNKPLIKARMTIVNNLEDPEIAKWYLTKKMRNEFGDKLSVESDVNLKVKTYDDEANKRLGKYTDTDV